MRFETKREREQRRKRQKRSAILGMVFAMLVVGTWCAFMEWQEEY